MQIRHMKRPRLIQVRESACVCVCVCEWTCLCHFIRPGVRRCSGRVNDNENHSVSSMIPHSFIVLSMLGLAVGVWYWYQKQRWTEHD